MANELTNINKDDFYAYSKPPTADVNPKKIGVPWFDYETGITYVCKDNTVNKNVWIKCCKTQEELDKYLEEWTASQKPPEGGNMVPGTNYTDEGVMEWYGVGGITYRGIDIYHVETANYHCCTGVAVHKKGNHIGIGNVGSSGNYVFLATFNNNGVVDVLRSTGKANFEHKPQVSSGVGACNTNNRFNYDPGDPTCKSDPRGYTWNTPYVAEWGCDYLTHGVKLYMNGLKYDILKIPPKLGIYKLRSVEEIINFKPDGPGIYSFNCTCYAYCISGTDVHYGGMGYYGSPYKGIDFILILEK